MQHRFLLALLSSLLSLSLNLFTHQNLFASFVNSLTLGLSVYFFQNLLNLKRGLFHYFILISSGLIPLFFFLPTNMFFSFFPLLILGIIYLYSRNPNKLFLVVFGFILFVGILYCNEVVKFPFEIQQMQLIYNSPEVNYNLTRHQEDALFLPYKMRLIVYSKLIYLYALLTNFFDFLNFKNLYETLMLANLYPLFIGIYKIIRENQKLKFLIITAFLITLFIAGLDRSPDKSQSLYLISPLLIYLIILGAENVNKKIYFLLWIISIFNLINPLI